MNRQQQRQPAGLLLSVVVCSRYQSVVVCAKLRALVFISRLRAASCCEPTEEAEHRAAWCKLCGRRSVRLRCWLRWWMADRAALWTVSSLLCDRASLLSNQLLAARLTSGQHRSLLASGQPDSAPAAQSWRRPRYKPLHYQRSIAQAGHGTTHVASGRGIASTRQQRRPMAVARPGHIHQYVSGYLITVIFVLASVLLNIHVFGFSIFITYLSFLFRVLD